MTQEAVKREEERLRAVAREAASLVARAEAEAARIANAMRIEGRRVVMESETTLISMAAERDTPPRDYEDVMFTPPRDY